MTGAAAFALHTRIGLDLGGAFLAQFRGLQIALAPTVVEATGVRDWLDRSATAIALPALTTAIEIPVATVLVIAQALGDVTFILASFPGASVAIVAPGPLSGGSAVPARYLAALREVKALDRNSRVRAVLGIGGWSSIVWAVLARLADRRKRLDLVDRFEIRYRQSLAPSIHRGAARSIAILADKE